MEEVFQLFSCWWETVFCALFLMLSELPQRGTLTNKLLLGCCCSDSQRYKSALFFPNEITGTLEVNAHPTIACSNLLLVAVSHSLLVLPPKDLGRFFWKTQPYHTYELSLAWESKDLWKFSRHLFVILSLWAAAFLMRASGDSGIIFIYSK